MKKFTVSIPDNVNKWPKCLPILSIEQEKISNDYVKYWHEVLPSKYNLVDRFNHQYVVRAAARQFNKTLEIGAGTGEHLQYEKLTQRQKEQYVAVDIRENMVAEFKRRYPEIRVFIGDCQKYMPWDDDSFDRILAIHVLEHLPNLPAAVTELHRLCDKKNGFLSIVIPCEGSLSYTIARRISAQRIFEKRYKQPYRWFIEREHINRPEEIFQELTPYFNLVHSSYFPLPIKIKSLNLCIGATFTPKRF